MHKSDGLWKSKGLDLTQDTCVDIEADALGVVIGHVGAVWSHNIFLTVQQIDWLVPQLIEARAQSLAARGDA